MKAASSAEPCLTGRVSAPAAGPAGLAAEAAQDHRDEGAVHPLAHDVGQDRARRADQRAGDDQRGVAQREADAGRRPARIGVEHRDHDRHVGAADRDDQDDAERERQPRDQPEADRALRHRRSRTMRTTSRPARRHVDAVARRQQDRRAGHVAVQLGEGDQRAGEGDGADGDAERQLDQALSCGSRRRVPMPKAAGA